MNCNELLQFRSQASILLPVSRLIVTGALTSDKNDKPTDDIDEFCYQQTENQRRDRLKDEWRYCHEISRGAHNRLLLT